MKFEQQRLALAARAAEGIDRQSAVVHAAREFNSAEQPLTSSLIPA
jgi:hypothetical protein